jgi:hypothetical protein
MAQVDPLSREALSQEILPLLRRHGATRVALFGSAARGQDQAGSDVDILVRFREPVGLFTLAQLQRELGARLGCSVDLVTEGALSPHIRPFVEREKVTLYEE